VPDDGAAFLMNAGISTYIDAKYAVALNKTTRPQLLIRNL